MTEMLMCKAVFKICIFLFKASILLKVMTDCGYVLEFSNDYYSFQRALELYLPDFLLIMTHMTSHCFSYSPVLSNINYFIKTILPNGSIIIPTFELKKKERNLQMKKKLTTTPSREEVLIC